MIKLIACVGRNCELGDTSSPDGLPWDREKEDMNYFKSQTEGGVVVMGGNTYRQLQEIGFTDGLPNRSNYVVTRDKLSDTENTCFGSAKCMEYLLRVGYWERDTWIIGGKSIYDQFWQYAEEVHLTRINREFPDADVILNTKWLDNYTLCDKVQLNDYSHVEVYKRK